MKYFGYCSEQEYTQYTTNEDLVVICLCHMTQLGFPALIQSRGTQSTRQPKPMLYYPCVIWSSGVLQHLFWAGGHRVHSNWESNFLHLLLSRSTQEGQQLRKQLYCACVIWSNGLFQHLFWAGVHRVHSNWEPSLLHLLWSRSTQGSQQLST